MIEKIGNKPKVLAPQIEKPTLLNRLNPVNQVRDFARRKNVEVLENKANALELEKTFVRTELINFLDKITEFKSKMDPGLYNQVLVNIPYSLSPAENVSRVDQTLSLDRNINSAARLKLLAKAIFKGSQKVEGYADNLPIGKVLGGAEILADAGKFDEYMPQAVSELLAESDIKSKLNEILEPKIEATQNFVNTIKKNLVRINTPLITVEIDKLLKYALTIKNEDTKFKLLQNIQTYTQKYLESGKGANGMPGPYEWIITRARGGNQTSYPTSG
jgi:hypothetical protein